MYMFHRHASIRSIYSESLQTHQNKITFFPIEIQTRCITYSRNLNYPCTH